MPCSVVCQMFFFPRWAGVLFLVLCTAHLPRMRNLVPTFAHPPPPTRSAAAGHTDAGGNPPLRTATAGRTNTCGNTPAPLSGEQAGRRSCRRRRRSSDKVTTRLANRPPPALQAPAATHLRPSPLDAPATGLANSGGGPVTDLLLPDLQPPTPRAAAGCINIGGDTPAPLPTRHVHLRSFQRRRRSRTTCTRTLPAAPPDTPSRHRPYRRRRRHTSAPRHPARPPPVLAAPAAEQKHVHAYLARAPPQHAEPEPAMQTPAATHRRPSSPDTSAAGLFNAGGGAEACARVPCPPPPPTRRAAAGETDAGGDAPAPLPTRHDRCWSCQLRRRRRSTCTRPLPAAHPNTQSSRRQNRRRR